MKKKMFLFLITFLMCTSQIVFASSQADAILGEWYTKDNESLVKIYRSGDLYYGKITWLTEKEATEPDGSPRLDAQNPDPQKAKRHLKGLVIAGDFAYEKKNFWSGGTIYDPANGKTYACNIQLRENGSELKVRGFIGISLLGRNEYWKRKK